MLEINDFNAIRISLASPEDVLGWSHGEVTKPETINYRTLRPERDGLFCERIFGPTRDWECYCGKYKRVRYRGVVCDKCGVEVTRSKVRRDRMAHITLASPVSHIWFVKGSPSRIGLLLDITPRNLERVLYFASYVITTVDDELKAATREAMQQDYREKRERIQGEAESRQIELSSQLNQDLGGMTSAQQSAQRRIDDDYRSQRDDLVTEAERLRSDLEERLGERVEEDIVYHGHTIIEEGEAITEKMLDALDELSDQEAEQVDVRRQRDMSDAELLTDAERERKTHEATQERERLQERLQSELDKMVREEKDRLEQLEGIRMKRILSEVEARNLRELAPGVFKADMGAGAVRDLILRTVDLDKLGEDLQAEVNTAQGQRRKKATKRLRVVEAFRKSGNRPEWMILTMLPVIPPDLRPMVQLDGGRFATSDLNDLYRRVINRNNRLKRLMELNAPEIIVRNEKRMLQEAVDALIDNGRRGRAVSGKGKHRLKSLSDMLKGKQGRFRQNLLGKRVDYSGRSVIVVGPNLQLHQCGLPKKMALELFKPFVMRRLVEKGFAHNIKSAKRIVERVRPEVWDVLEEVIKDYLVLLNRAPSLHRLSIQAFEAKLIEGSAIQLHPLVCSAFNADFDGDQMAVHVPLSRMAQDEARMRMLSKYNLLSPATGDPIVTPSQDIVLGCYYITLGKGRSDSRGAGKIFASAEEAIMAYEQGVVEIQAPIWVRVDRKYGRYEGVRNRDGIEDLDAIQYWIDPALVQTDDAAHQAVLDKLSVFRVNPSPADAALSNGLSHRKLTDGTTLLETTIGLLIFNSVLLPPLAYRNDPVAKKGLKEIIAECYKYYTNIANISPADMAAMRERFGERSDLELLRLFGSEMTAIQADLIKALGFKYATHGGMTVGIDDIEVPTAKIGILAASEVRVDDVEKQFRRGLITAEERYREIVDIWQGATRETTKAVRANLNRLGPVTMMVNSAARGNINQLSQMAGMRGLMSDPNGRIIEKPIKSNFREGLSVLEYFISTHGGRKGLADTALRTADAGYLTRRLIDVAQDNIITMDDCGTEDGLWLYRDDDREVLQELETRVFGRILAMPILHPTTGEVLVARNEEMIEDSARFVREHKLNAIFIRSALACKADHGLCRRCYGRNLATGKLVESGEAVGIIAAQSIGEPGTQLTLRTFHTGGVASADDITQGLPRVQEIFEARSPKGKALLAPMDGVVEILREDEVRKLRVTSNEIFTDEHDLPAHYSVLVNDGDDVGEGQILAESNRANLGGNPLVAQLHGKVRLSATTLVIVQEERAVSDLLVPATARISPALENGMRVTAGQHLTEGSADPQELLELRGKEAVQRYLVNEAQRVYRSQGVDINDKHIEVIVRQMLRRVRIDEPGDTGLLPGEIVDGPEFARLNTEIVSQGGSPATASTVLMGITKASLTTDSFLSAASFQETTRVLTEAAITGKVDYLRGLKENVVIGKLIPAGTGIEKRRQLAEEMMNEFSEPRASEEVRPALVGGRPDPLAHPSLDGDEELRRALRALLEGGDEDLAPVVVEGALAIDTSIDDVPAQEMADGDEQ